MGSICVILSKYFKILYFTNLVCTMKFLKYKSLENFQLYCTLTSAHNHCTIFQLNITILPCTCSQRKVMRAMSRKSFRMKKGGKGKPKKSLTVGGLFQQSLKQLMERIFAATPHFIRCIKPNYEKSPGLCDDSFMLTQLT